MVLFSSSTSERRSATLSIVPCSSSERVSVLISTVRAVVVSIVVSEISEFSEPPAQPVNEAARVSAETPAIIRLILFMAIVLSNNNCYVYGNNNFSIAFSYYNINTALCQRFQMYILPPVNCLFLTRKITVLTVLLRYGIIKAYCIRL